MIYTRSNEGYKVIINRFWAEAKRNKIKLIGSIPTANAFGKARRKLPSEEIRRINTEAAGFFDEHFGKDYLWRGHRVYAIDGSKVTLTSHPKIIETFGLPNNNKNAHYAQALVSTLFNVFSKVPVDMSIETTLANERVEAVKLFKKNLSPGDIITFDSGYPSYDILNELINLKIHFIIRVPLTSCFRPVVETISSGKNDDIVQLDLFTSKKKGAGKHINNIRVVVYEPESGKKIAIITDLIDKTKYPAEELARLYHFRWESEEFYKAGKHLSDIEKFHAKYPDGIKQELYALILTYTITRIIESEARNRDQLSSSSPDNQNENKISTHVQIKNHNGLQAYNLKNSLGRVGYYLQELTLSNNKTRNRLLFEYLIEEIRNLPYTRRENRKFPRVRKKPFKNKFLKKRIRHQEKRGKQTINS
jgi:hypothetical protein